MGRDSAGYTSGSAIPKSHPGERPAERSVPNATCPPARGRELAVKDSGDDEPVSFYLEPEPGRFRPTQHTAGPWGPDSQHGAPPAALLARAIERLDRETPRVVGRFTMELLGPVPVAPVRVEASVLRPGRTVELCEAVLYDERRDRACAKATAWLFPESADGPADEPTPLPHGPDDGVTHERPPGWSPGYMEAVDWRWAEGAVTQPGPAVVWMRPNVPLVDDEPLSPLQRLLVCADSGNGASAALDTREWTFLNTDLSVHILRPPTGEWVCLSAETVLGGGSVGIACARLHDERGLTARSAQALLLARRR